jgi:hypothetical protein
MCKDEAEKILYNMKNEDKEYNNIVVASVKCVEGHIR